MPGHGRVMTSSPTCPRTGVPSSPKHSAAMPGIGPGERARLDRRDGEAAEDAAGDLRPTRVVDDRDARLAGVLEQPAVGLGIPRLAGGAQDAERREIVGVDVLGAVRHERPHGRGRDAEDADAVALDDAPQAVGLGIVLHALEHHGRAAVEERGGDRHRSHQPAEIGQPEQPIALADVHAVGEVVRGLDEEAAVGEHRALRPSRRPRRVDDEARPIGLDRQRRRTVALTGDGLVPPAVASRRPRDLASEAPVDQDVLDRRALSHRLVGRLPSSSPSGRGGRSRRR